MALNDLACADVPLKFILLLLLAVQFYVTNSCPVGYLQIVTFAVVQH